MTTPKNSIQITQSDFNKLQDLLQTTIDATPQEKACREALFQELLRAKIMPSDEIPADVITLHSRARLADLDADETLEYSIVLPGEADVESGRISILAPLGTAMLGFRKGDTFEWAVPGGLSRFRVEEILYQPEAAAKAA